MEGWSQAKLGDVCEMVKRGVAPKYIESKGLCVINQKCIRDHAVNLELARRHDLEQKKVNEERLVQPGDVLVNSTGVGTLGRVAQVRDNLPEAATVDTHVTIVRPKSGLFYSDFFGYMLIKIEDEIAASGEGASGQTELSRKVLSENFSVSYPDSLPEQEQIVAILDEAFAAIATATANAEKNLANARELFESHSNQLFTRLADSLDEKTLDEVCENLDRQRVPITKAKRIAGSIPYYGASGIVDHVEKGLFDEDLLLVSEDGANLLARTYPIAFSISGPSWVNNHAHVLRFKSMQYQKYIEYYLNSISLEPFVSGMAQPKLNQGKLNSIPIPWPKDEQQASEVVESLSGIESESDALSNIMKAQLTHLTNLKQSLLHKAFTGELTADKKAADRTLSEAGL